MRAEACVRDDENPLRPSFHRKPTMLRAALSLLIACCLLALAQQPVITGHIVPHSHDDGL